MFINILQIAKSTIPKPDGKKDLVKERFVTEDIINVIMQADAKAATYTKEFAKHLKGSSDYQTCFNIWSFLKGHIRYIEDKTPTQDVKSPASLVHSGYGDCKSFSIFTASILKNLGIPYSYRFASYSNSPVPTHVYIIAHTGKGNVIIDAVWHYYDSEKEFKHKKDYYMSLNYVHGIGADQKPGRLVIPDIDNLTEGELDLLIAKQNREILQDQVRRIKGIGSLTEERLQDEIDVLNDAINSIRIGEDGLYLIEDVESGKYSQAGQLAGIGDIGCRCQERAKNLAQLRVSRRNRKNIGHIPQQPQTAIGNFLKNAFNKVKSAVKTVAKKAVSTAKTVATKAASAAKTVAKTAAKVVTAPARLLVKGILEVMLPKAAPYFLYLFVNDQNLINKLPEKARKKRKKSEGIANFIVNVIGMKREHFMGIVRNGILKRYGKSPETVIAEASRGKIKGIGAFPLILIGPLLELLGKIMSVFKKKPAEDVSAQDAPDPDNDFADMSSGEQQQFSGEVKRQPGGSNELDQNGNTPGGDEYSGGDSGGGSNSGGGTGVRKTGFC